MQLTRYTDYAVRVLLHVGSRDDGDQSSINEIAETYGISRDTLKKLVQDLSRAGLLDATRGRGGGLRLGKDPAHMTIGSIVRHTEPGFNLVDCSSCLVAPACTLPSMLNEATKAFLAVLDKYTLADLLQRKVALKSLFTAGMRSSLHHSDKAEGPDF